MIDIILQLGALSAPAARDLLAALRERFRRGGREFWRSRAYAIGEDKPDAVPPAWARYGGARPELRGAPRNTILAVKGLEKMTPAFRARLLDLCEGLGIPVDSMAAIMSSESAPRRLARVIWSVYEHGTRSAASTSFPPSSR